MAQFLNFAVTFYSASINSTGWGEQRAAILLELESTIPATCNLVFYPDSATLPQNQLYTTSNRIQMVIYLRYSDYPNVVDLLRNEKPVYIFYRDDARVFVIKSGSEPVGEHEPT